jgi:hypothetical protein
MVKRRSPETPTTDADRIEAFANQADGGEAKKPDPNAPRNYKKINVPFNEYEFEMLEEAAEKTGRSKLNFIRWAILKATKD